MPFDGLAIKAVARELDAALKDARIDKIHQPEKDELVLSIRQYKSTSVRLLISANARWARIHISNEKKPNPTHPSGFCMLLRKYLEGGKIKEVKQLGMERILHIRIEALDDFREWKDKILVCEFMGRHSNIILVNPENGIILDAIKKYGSELSSFREVLPGKPYVSPPDQGKLEPGRAVWDEFTRKMWQQEENQSLAAALFNTYTGISPYSARHICLTCGTDPDLPVGQCGEFELSKVFYAIQSLLADIDQGKLSPVVLYDKFQLPLEFSPFTPLSDKQAEIKVYSSMNEACDVFFTDKMDRLRLDSMKTSLTRKIKEHLDKLYRKKFHQEGDLAKAYDHDIYKDWGELLTAYAHLYKKGDTEVTLNDFGGDQTVTLTLDPRFTPIQNAQRYFKIYNKSRGARKHLQVLMAQNQQEIDYLESVLVAVQQAEDPSGLKEIIEELEKEGYIKAIAKKNKIREERSQPRRFLSSDGLVITVGRNNRQNDWLTLRESDGSDLWLHTKEIPGTHVILSLPAAVKSIQDVPDKSLEEAATLAAYYSKANQSEKVPVDYTFRSNVKKPGGAKPGMVIYDNYWTIMVNPCSPLLEQLLSAQRTD
ncbi:Fibronectin-binding A, N-terminal [Syntrophomonas zehnderi OL-4]|uniref:Rqc2 homolog RqcH n=1 Tax=Syntrophomonas zehnderi OL-4 TaxID=690567 RepID=A0A0E3W3E1_9FIRM|nr:NFACT RNA binding domain-containing protein [Syntrophomonas zehnderi]CFX75563.1 Fibronectin-binding A, N-terminal [Syntrophomonas zehnderi OL-4]